MQDDDAGEHQRICSLRCPAGIAADTPKLPHNVHQQLLKVKRVPIIRRCMVNLQRQAQQMRQPVGTSTCVTIVLVVRQVVALFSPT